MLGIVHNPIMKETFHAIKGKGAYLNGKKKLKVSNNTEIDKALISTEYGYERSEQGESMQLKFRIQALPKHI